MIEYVAGLMFCEEGRFVAMVEKQKPEWMKGKYNAIGGKIEPGEFTEDAMVREFQEETGVHYKNWMETATLEGKDWRVYFYHCFADPFMCDTVEEERIIVDEVNSFLSSSKLMGNLKTIINIALDHSIVKPVMLESY